MSQIRCLGCGQVTAQNRSGRCPRCKRDAEKARWGRADRVARKRTLYDATYRKTREIWAEHFRRGGLARCPRCGGLINSEAGFDLGHQKDGSLQPECIRCNRSAGARKDK